MANPSLDPTKTTSDIVSEEALAADPITTALAPVLASLQALSDKLDAFIAADAVQDAEEMGSGIPNNDQKIKPTGMDDGGDESEMSAKLSAVMTKLSILEAANVGSTPVETPREEITGDNIVAKYEAISSPVEKAAFAKQYDRALRSALAARK
jgi:hypothetical protein